MGRDLTAFGLQDGGRVGADRHDHRGRTPERHGRGRDLRRVGAQERVRAARQAGHEPETQIDDSDAIAAQAYSKIVAYYEALGRDSWDDQGGPLISSVHFGPDTYCNAMFAS